MKLFKYIAYLSFFALLFRVSFAIMGADPVENFDDPASIIFVFAGVLFALGQFRFSEIFHAFQDALGFSSAEDFAERWTLDLVVLKTLGNLAVLAGGIGSAMGFVQALGNAEDVNALTITFGLSLLAILYGLIFKFIFLQPLSFNLETQAIEAGLKTDTTGGMKLETL